MDSAFNSPYQQHYHYRQPHSQSPPFFTRNSYSFRSSPRSSPPTLFHAQSPPSPPRQEPLNLQARRLQLRHARFQGARISPDKVLSERVRRSSSTWRSPSPASKDLTNNKENYLLSSASSDNINNNDPLSAEHEQRPLNKTPDSTPGSVRSRVSILQELHESSSYRGRKPRRTSLSHLFGPSLDASNRSSLNRTTPSNSRQSSPPYSWFRDNDGQTMIAAHNQDNRSSPLPSSNTKHLRDTSRDNTNNHATERYIEHLEAQLAAVQNPSSPMQTSTGKAQHSRLRSLNAEVKLLRQEIAEWEDKFEVRVHEELELRTDIESKLRTKIIFLEGQLDEFTTRVRELECERDLQAQKLRNVEALRSTNRGLERRIDVLTELLAQSPTKAETLRSPEMSPSRSPGPRLSRPKSMLSSTPAKHDMAYESRIENDVPELAPDDSTVASSVVTKSQRSSTLSHASTVATRWSVPLPFSPELQGRTPGRPRNMRRFPSGTVNLKPLILPATATPAPSSPQRQYLAGEEFPSVYSPDSEPELTKEATAFAQEETLAALEGRRSHYHAHEGILSEPEDDNSFSDSPLSGRSRRGVQRYSSTLYTELQEAEISESEHSCMRRSSPTHSRQSTLDRSYRLSTSSSRYSSRAYGKAQFLDYVSTVDLTHGMGNSTDTQNASFIQRVFTGIWRRTARQFGPLSWWIFGIILGSERRSKWSKSFSSSLRLPFDLEAQQRTSSSFHICQACGEKIRYSCRGTEDYGHKKEGNDGLKGLKRTALMWARFSIAIVIALARALRNGPESVLLLPDK